MPSPPADLVIRPATPEDARSVAAMARALSRDEGASRPSRFTAAAFRRDGFGADPAFACLVAELAGRRVGYALHFSDYDTDRMRRSVYLADLYVARGLRGRGIGRALMAAVAHAGRQAGAAVMAWAVLPGNAPARRFYASIGEEQPDFQVFWCGGRRFDRLRALPPTEGLAVRAAAPADLPALAAMQAALLAGMGDRPPPDLAARLAADGFGRQPAFALLLAERAGRPVGYSLFWPAYDSDLAARGLLLSDLYLRPEARGSGAAAALMAATARAAAAGAGRFLFWPVKRDNGRARALYKRFGDADEAILCVAAEERFARLAADGAAAVRRRDSPR